MLSGTNCQKLWKKDENDLRRCVVWSLFDRHQASLFFYIFHAHILEWRLRQTKWYYIELPFVRVYRNLIMQIVFGGWII